MYVYMYLWIDGWMYACMHVCMDAYMYVCVCVYIYVCMYVGMYVGRYVCMFKIKGCVMVYHTVSGLKCNIRRTPPPRLLKAQKNMWGGIFHVVR